MNGPKPRILVIDSVGRSHRSLRPALLAEGYRVTQAATGAEGLRLARIQPPHAVLLDLDLPDIDGYDVLGQICALGDMPVIVTSARSREADKIRALDSGACDYVGKPVAVGELLARVRAALRRSMAGAAPRRLAFAGLTVDIGRRLAIVHGAPVALTSREWSLLVTLAGNAGRVMTHGALLTAVWGQTHADNLQYLRVYVGTLRQKLGPAGSLIVTETGVGYRMAEPIDPAPRP
jgi:two-component system KDP operon response regulator KdpE